MSPLRANKDNRTGGRNPQCTNTERALVLGAIPLSSGQGRTAGRSSHLPADRGSLLPTGSDADLFTTAVKCLNASMESVQ